VAGLIAGVALTACSLGLICGGAFAAWARAGGTYIDLGAHGTYSTHTYALATDGTDWRKTHFGWAGSVRLEVCSSSGAPGVQRARERDPQRDEVHTSPSHIERRRDVFWVIESVRGLLCAYWTERMSAANALASPADRAAVGRPGRSSCGE
jgi:hypothetical protein